MKKILGYISTSALQTLRAGDKCSAAVMQKTEGDWKHPIIEAGESDVRADADADMIVEWWISQKPFGQSIGEYLELPDNWVAGAAKPLARRAAELYMQRQA